MSQPSNGKSINPIPDSEVLPKAQRRQYSAEYKRQILQEYEACTAFGEKGALLRREGLYTSHITTWRRQGERAELEGLTPQKRGPKADPQAAELARLQRENARLRKRLEQAELIIEFQKKSLRSWAFRSRRTGWTIHNDRASRRTGPEGKRERGLPGVGNAPE